MFVACLTITNRTITMAVAVRSRELDKLSDYLSILRNDFSPFIDPYDDENDDDDDDVPHVTIESCMHRMHTYRRQLDRLHAGAGGRTVSYQEHLRILNEELISIEQLAFECFAAVAPYRVRVA